MILFIFFIIYLITLSFHILSFMYLFWSSILRFVIFIFNSIYNFYNNNDNNYIPLLNSYSDNNFNTFTDNNFNEDTDNFNDNTEDIYNSIIFL